MRRLLSALLLAACLFSAPVAANNLSDLRTAARDAGLPDTVEVVAIESASANGAFWHGGMLCTYMLCEEVGPFVGIAVPPDYPREFALMILFHEVGHYHQWVAGWLDGIRDQPSLEWDADLFAIGELCRLGLNGPEVAANALASLGDFRLQSDTHGALAGRIAHARAQRCGLAVEVGSAP